jgi:hypothetical protein
MLPQGMKPRSEAITIVPAGVKLREATARRQH